VVAPAAVKAAVFVPVLVSPVKLIVVDIMNAADAFSVTATVCEPDVDGLRNRNKYRMELAP
jgi:hypothetical protein